MTSTAPVLGLVGCALMFGVSVTSSQALVRAHDPALQIAIEARDKSFHYPRCCGMVQIHC